MDNFIIPVIVFGISIVFLVFAILAPKNSLHFVKEHNLDQNGQVAFILKGTNKYLALVKNDLDDTHNFKLIDKFTSDCIFDYHASNSDLLYEYYKDLTGIRWYKEHELREKVKTIKFIDSPHLNTAIRACEIESTDDNHVLIKFTGRHFCGGYTILKIDKNQINYANKGRVLHFKVVSSQTHTMKDG